MTLQLISASRLKDFRRCARLHHLRHELGYKPAQEDEALRFGTLIHEGLEAWWRGLLEDPGIDGHDLVVLALDALRFVPSPGGRVSREVDQYELAKAEALLVGYHARWLEAGLEPLAVEVEFKAPLLTPKGNPMQLFEVGGRIDVLVRDRQGRVLVVEHKTSGEDISVGSPYWARLRMDGQVSMYFEGGKALGHDIAGCLYDVIAKPQLRPKEVPLVDEDGAKIVLDANGVRVRTKDGKKWRETADAEKGYVLKTRPETPEEFAGRISEAIAKAPEKYFARGEVMRLEAEVDEFRHELWQQARMIRESQLARRAPRNPEACTAYNKVCAFFEACSGSASLDDTTRFKRELKPHHLAALEAVATEPAAMAG